MVTYVVGDGVGCDDNTVDTCNGALRDDTSYVVASATCTAGGCVVTPYAEAIRRGMWAVIFIVL